MSLRKRQSRRKERREVKEKKEQKKKQVNKIMVFFRSLYICPLSLSFIYLDLCIYLCLKKMCYADREDKKWKVDGGGGKEKRAGLGKEKKNYAIRAMSRNFDER